MPRGPWSLMFPFLEYIWRHKCLIWREWYSSGIAGKQKRCHIFTSMAGKAGFKTFYHWDLRKRNLPTSTRPARSRLTWDPQRVMQDYFGVFIECSCIDVSVSANKKPILLKIFSLFGNSLNFSPHSQTTDPSRSRSDRISNSGSVGVCGNLIELSEAVRDGRWVWQPGAEINCSALISVQSSDFFSNGLEQIKSNKSYNSI